MIQLHRLASLFARLVAVATFTLVIVGHPPGARADTYDWESSPNYQFRMWIDDGQEVVYGLYVIFNESAGDTRTLVDRERYIDWARSMGFGIVGTRFEAPGDNGDDTEQSATLITALENFAEMSGHPEIVNAPLVTDGISLGGHNSIKFAAIYPERTIAYLGGAAGRVPVEVSNPAFARVPGLFYHGELDSDIEDANDRRDDFLALRADGIETGFFVQWEFGHERGYADRVGWKILSDMVSLRYPIDQSPVDGPVTLREIPVEEGWLADHTTWTGSITAIEPYEGAASPNTKFWLPTRDAAYVYRAHATRDRALSFVSPPGPEIYDSVDPGAAVAIEISIGDLTGVAMVEIFDGSLPIAQLTQPPYTATWTAEHVGMHALVAVATLGDGTKRTGYAAPVMVLGTERPGLYAGGTGGDDGADDGTDDDGAGDDGAGDDGSGDGTDDGDNGADGGGAGSDGGCGCRTGDRGGAGPLGFALVAGLALLVVRRRGG